MEDTLNGTESFNVVASQLLEQKAAVSDESDYLWHMTSSIKDPLMLQQHPQEDGASAVA
ncbi:hypothetical protein ACLOJK_020155 [Asimina triloba]